MIRHCNLQLCSFRHVKGHSGNAGNERCDLLCTMAMNAYLAEAAE